VPGTLDVKVSVKKLESVVRLPDGADRISVALIPPGVTDRRTRRAICLCRAPHLSATKIKRVLVIFCSMPHLAFSIVGWMDGWWWWFDRS